MVGNGLLSERAYPELLADPQHPMDRKPRGRRFQGDTQWQKDFASLCKVSSRRDAYVHEGHRLLAAGDRVGARRQLDAADEDTERMGLLEHALRDIGP